jgi:hypothetical protein
VFWKEDCEEMEVDSLSLPLDEKMKFMMGQQVG